ncbi:hypothetical protein ACET3Z_010635 [Daucus carota]
MLPKLHNVTKSKSLFTLRVCLLTLGLVVRFQFNANDLLEWKDFPKGLRVLLLVQETDSAAQTRSKLEVPVAAAVYYEDMFVNFQLAIEAESRIARMRLFVTNEYMHSGLRDGTVDGNVEWEKTVVLTLCSFNI